MFSLPLLCLLFMGCSQQNQPPAPVQQAATPHDPMAEVHSYLDEGDKCMTDGRLAAAKAMYEHAYALYASADIKEKIDRINKLEEASAPKPADWAQIKEDSHTRAMQDAQMTGAQSGPPPAIDSSWDAYMSPAERAQKARERQWRSEHRGLAAAANGAAVNADRAATANGASSEEATHAGAEAAGRAGRAYDAARKRGLSDAEAGAAAGR
jgi:hypothetical protein